MLFVHVGVVCKKNEAVVATVLMRRSSHGGDLSCGLVNRLSQVKVGEN